MLPSARKHRYRFLAFSCLRAVWRADLVLSRFDSTHDDCSKVASKISPLTFASLSILSKKSLYLHLLTESRTPFAQPRHKHHKHPTPTFRRRTERVMTGFALFSFLGVGAFHGRQSSKWEKTHSNSIVQRDENNTVSIRSLAVVKFPDC